MLLRHPQKVRRGPPVKPQIWATSRTKEEPVYIGKAIRSYVIEPVLNPVPRRKPSAQLGTLRPQPAVKRTRV